MAKQKKGYKESLLALISSGAFTGFFLLLTMCHRSKSVESAGSRGWRGSAGAGVFTR